MLLRLKIFTGKFFIFVLFLLKTEIVGAKEPPRRGGGQSLDSICGVNGFQQGSNKQFLWAREKYMRYHMHQSFVSPAPM